MNVTSLIVPALTYGPTLIDDAEAVFNDIAHGEGGAAKIENVIASLAHLLESAVGAAGSAGAISSTTVSAVSNAVATVATATGTVVSQLAPAPATLAPTPTAAVLAVPVSPPVSDSDAALAGPPAS